MLKVTLDNVHQKRTIRPLYANTQATPYGCFLDPERDASEGDILPGSVMTKLENEKVGLMTDATQEPFGLSALFVAPSLGIDEVAGIGQNLFAVWVGDNQSVFEVLAPAFDDTATWTMPTDGSRVPLYSTLAGHAAGAGKLTPVAGTTDSANNISEKVVATLVSIVSTNKIIVSLDNKANG